MAVEVKKERGNRRRLHGRIAQQLGIAITAGHYQPGDLLDGEIEFSDRLEVSRTVYREALRMLSAKGMVESKPRSGTHVLPRHRWNLLDPDVLEWMFENEPSEPFVRNLFELRMIIEPEAAALAAERRTAVDLARMGHALEEMSKHTLLTPQGQAADQEFHSLLLAATRNEALINLGSTIAAAVRWTTYFKQRRRGLGRDALPDHRNIYEAIAQGSPSKARKAMVALVQLALDDTREVLREPTS